MDEIIGGVFMMVTVITGRVIVRLVSLGRWRSEPFLGNEGRIYGAAGALSFVRDGQRVITETGLMFVGLAFYVAAIVLAISVFAMN
jgi:hypothetical protein